jgi:hypothetical protein
VLKRLKGEPSASLTACSLVFMLPFVRPIRRPRSPFTCKLAPCVAPYLNERPESERVKRALNVRVWVLPAESLLAVDAHSRLGPIVCEAAAALDYAIGDPVMFDGLKLARSAVGGYGGGTRRRCR